MLLKRIYLKILQKLFFFRIFIRIINTLEKMGLIITLKYFHRVGFELFRYYGNLLNFRDQQILAELWYRRYPSQKYFDTNFYKSCFNRLPKNIKVIELGGYQGELALEILKNNPDIKWINFEIIKHNTLLELKKYDYEEYVLSKQIWESEINLSGYDAFICSDTLEHFTDENAIKILNTIKMNTIKYVLLKIPISKDGQNWVGYYGSHALTLGSDKIKQVLMNYGFKLIYETGSWCSFWENKLKSNN